MTATAPPPAVIDRAGLDRFPRRNAAPLLADCRQLSAGTIAVLTGRREYAAIDAIRENFLVAVDREVDAGRGFETWVNAWLEFSKGREF